MSSERSDDTHPDQATPQGSSGSTLCTAVNECLAGLSKRTKGILEADKSVATLSLLTDATLHCGNHLVGLKTATKEAEKIVCLVMTLTRKSKGLVNLMMTALMCTLTLFMLFSNVQKDNKALFNIAEYLFDFGTAMGMLHHRIEDLARSHRNCVSRILFRQRIKKRMMTLKQDILSTCVGRLREFIIRVPAVADAFRRSPTACSNLGEADVWRIAESAEGRPWIVSDNVTFGDDTANTHTRGSQAAGSRTGANATVLILRSDTGAPSTIGPVASTNGSVTITDSEGAVVINGSSSAPQVFRG